MYEVVVGGEIKQTAIGRPLHVGGGKLIASGGHDDRDLLMDALHVEGESGVGAVVCIATLSGAAIAWYDAQGVYHEN